MGPGMKIKRGQKVKCRAHYLFTKNSATELRQDVDERLVELQLPKVIRP